MTTLQEERNRVVAQARDVDEEWAIPSTGPGPYEGNADRELAKAIDVLDNLGYADDAVGNTDDGLYGARVGPFVLWTDDQGFKNLMVFPGEEAAQHALDREERRQYGEPEPEMVPIQAPPHPATAALLRYFSWEHLPPHLRHVSQPCALLAHDMVARGLDGPELTVGLRKLLEAKDCFVRAAMEREAHHDS